MHTHTVHVDAGYTQFYPDPAFGQAQQVFSPVSYVCGGNGGGGGSSRERRGQALGAEGGGEDK